MKGLRHYIILLVALSLTTAGSAEGEGTKPVVHLSINLVDGSHVVGIPNIKTVRVHTPYAEMDIPLSTIQNIKVEEDHERASLEMRNGDTIQGVVDLGPLKLKTIFGKVSVGVEYVRTIKVRLEGSSLSTSLKKGLVLHYSFETERGAEVTDQSGNGNNGTLKGAFRTVDGKRGHGCEFDGTDDFLDAGNPQDLQLTKNFTIAAWIYADRGAGARSIVSKTFGHPQQSRRGLEFYISGSQLVSYFWDSSSRYFRGVVDFPSESAPRWHHVVLQHDASMPDHQMRMYLDGKEKELRFNYETISSIPEIRNVAETLKVGCFRPGTAHFKGKIDEVLIFNRVLTTEEIKQLLYLQESSVKGLGLMSYAGLDWHPWRVDFRVDGNRISTLPRPRSGFGYGHSEHGRNAIFATHIGDQNWTDYDIDLDFMMLPVTPEFYPHHIPKGTARGFYLLFRVQDLKESWNEPGRTSYQLSFNENGNWGLTRAHNWFCQRASGYGNLSANSGYPLRNGKIPLLNLNKSNHLQLKVKGKRIQAWLNDNLIVDYTDDNVEVGGTPIGSGGIAFSWRYESMGWVENFRIKHLK